MGNDQQNLARRVLHGAAYLSLFRSSLLTEAATRQD